MTRDESKNASDHTPPTFETVEELGAWLLDRLPHGRSAVVAVDGSTGSGKTTLARALAPRINAVVVSLDGFLPRGEEASAGLANYVGTLDREALDRSVKSLRKDGRVVVVDGIRVLDALDLVGIAPNALVHVRRISREGVWQDYWLCDPPCIDLGHPQLQRPGAGLDRQVAEYHLRRNPASRADAAVFRRTEAE